MSELTIFVCKVLIIVLAIPLTFLLVYLTGLLIARMASRFCPECKKRKRDNKLKKELLGEERIKNRD